MICCMYIISKQFSEVERHQIAATSEFTLPDIRNKRVSFAFRYIILATTWRVDVLRKGPEIRLLLVTMLFE